MGVAPSGVMRDCVEVSRTACTRRQSEARCQGELPKVLNVLSVVFQNNKKNQNVIIFLPLKTSATSGCNLDFFWV